MNKKTYVSPWFNPVALYCSAQTTVNISGDDDDDSDKSRYLEWDDDEEVSSNSLGLNRNFWSE